MLVATVQCLSSLIDKNYKPSVLKSRFAFTDKEYLEGYRVMLERLTEFTNRPYILGVSSCYWVWVDNPFFSFPGYGNEKCYVCIVDVPLESLVMSDYDKWSNFVNKGTVELKNCFTTQEDLGKGKCIQGVMWDLNWDKVVCACPLSNVLAYGCKSIQDVVNIAYLCDESTILSQLRNDKPFNEVSKYVKDALSTVGAMLSCTTRQFGNLGIHSSF